MRGSGAEVSNAVRSLFTETAKTRAEVPGWCGTYYPEESWILFQVPFGPPPELSGQQIVMNSQTGAWTTFSGMQAACWLPYQGSLYFGGEKAVHVVEPSGEDEVFEENAFVQRAIKGYAQPAFSRPGTGGDYLFTALQAHLRTPVFSRYTLEGVKDYGPTGSPSILEGEAGVAGSSLSLIHI